MKYKNDLFRWREELKEIEQEKELIFGDGGTYEQGIEDS